MRAWRLAIWAICLYSVTCGSGSTTPSAKITLSGVVRDTVTSAPLGGARVEITGGANSGQSATADALGHYTLSNLVTGSMTLRATASNYVPQTTSVSPTADLVTDFKLAAGLFSTSASAQDSLSLAPLVGVTATGADVGSSSSDGSGALSIFAATSSPSPRTIEITGPGMVTRNTSVRIPGDAAVLDLIPKAFDLTGFDQLVRSGGTLPLERWTAAPGLIVVARTLQYVNSNSLVDAVATPEALTDEEVASLVGDMSNGLPLMTGGTFTAFSSVVIQTPDAGQTVHLRNTGFVTVSRQLGLTNGSGIDALGYGSWQLLGPIVTGGTIALDQTNDVGAFQKPVRYHELGHALGYNHVTTRVSVMNPVCCSVIDPNPADQQATRLAFRRLPGSLTPDKDPGSSLNELGLTPVWMPPIR
jgi:hypothetical protein